MTETPLFVFAPASPADRAELVEQAAHAIAEGMWPDVVTSFDRLTDSAKIRYRAAAEAAADVFLGPTA
ncbi:hypothetical protein [Amycolatopsis thermoflava]|uniref:hypothetical protein n=1 Tax=Amycolatopsis thermoflava TaxID=84480 RepID=UPI0004051101|nr:hypothetical protein [Amycolatopsis thermoflava]